MKINKLRLTKNDITKKINSKLGISSIYLNKIIDNLILNIQSSIKKEKLNIMNFGTFKSINKRSRIGRNPKNKEIFKIEARKTVGFLISNDFNKKINKF